MIMFFNFDRLESFSEIFVPHFCGVSSKQRQNVENTEVSIFNLVRALCSICISKTGHEKSQKLFVVFWEKPPELILYLIKSCKKNSTSSIWYMQTAAVHFDWAKNMELHICIRVFHRFSIFGRIHFDQIETCSSVDIDEEKSMWSSSKINSSIVLTVR